MPAAVCKVFILLIIGILTIKKYRGFWLKQQFKEKKDTDEDKKLVEQLKETNVILGIFYIILAVGILSNYLTHFLIWLLEPLPDGFIFDFLNFSGEVENKYIERISDLEEVKHPHEKTIYYCIAYTSFMAFLNIILGVRHAIIMTNKSHKISFGLLMSGVSMGVLAGFTTFMPLFLL